MFILYLCYYYVQYLKALDTRDILSTLACDVHLRTENNRHSDQKWEIDY